jgi:hypothetical protein
MSNEIETFSLDISREPSSKKEKEKYYDCITDQSIRADYMKCALIICELGDVIPPLIHGILRNDNIIKEIYVLRSTINTPSLESKNETWQQYFPQGQSFSIPTSNRYATLCVRPKSKDGIYINPNSTYLIEFVKIHCVGNMPWKFNYREDQINVSVDSTYILWLISNKYDSYNDAVDIFEIGPEIEEFCNGTIKI